MRVTWGLGVLTFHFLKNFDLFKVFLNHYCLNHRRCPQNAFSLVHCRAAPDSLLLGVLPRFPSLVQNLHVQISVHRANIRLWKLSTVQQVEHFFSSKNYCKKPQFFPYLSNSALQEKVPLLNRFYPIVHILIVKVQFFYLCFPCRVRVAALH